MTVQTRKMTIREFREDAEVVEAARRLHVYGNGPRMSHAGRELVGMGAVPPIVFYRKSGRPCPAILTHVLYMFDLLYTPLNDDALEQEVAVYVVDSDDPADVELAVSWVQTGRASVYRSSYKMFDPNEPIAPWLTVSRKWS